MLVAFSLRNSVEFSSESFDSRIHSAGEDSSTAVALEASSITSQIYFSKIRGLSSFLQFFFSSNSSTTPLAFFFPSSTLSYDFVPSGISYRSKWYTFVIFAIGETSSGENGRVGSSRIRLVRIALQSVIYVTDRAPIWWCPFPYLSFPFLFSIDWRSFWLGLTLNALLPGLWVDGLGKLSELTIPPEGSAQPTIDTRAEDMVDNSY